MSEFFAMGRLRLYVWGSFGATALVVAAELLSLRARRAGRSTRRGWRPPTICPRPRRGSCGKPATAASSGSAPASPCWAAPPRWC